MNYPCNCGLTEPYCVKMVGDPQTASKLRGTINPPNTTVAYRRISLVLTCQLTYTVWERIQLQKKLKPHAIPSQGCACVALLHPIE